MKLKWSHAWLVLSLWSALLVTAAPAAVVNTNGTQFAVSAEVQATNGVTSVSTVVRTWEKGVSFGLDRIAVLRPTLFGIPRYQYIASLIFIALAFYFSKLLDLAVGKQLRKWAARTKTRIDDLIIGLIHGPIKIVSFVILLHIGLQVFPWPTWIRVWASRGLLVVVACSVTYMVLKCVDALVEYWRNRIRARDDRMLNEQLFSVVSKTLKAFIVVVAVLVTTQNLGLNITAMLASLSIGGLALGLAAQDTVANLFGAVAVFVDKPFRVGDRIRLDGIDGTVETIGLRSTRVRNLDGHLITVPNKTMGNATITNITRRPSIRTEMNIGITYNTPAERVKHALTILNEVYRKHPMTKDLVIAFNKFADFSLNITIIHWWGSTDFREYLAGMQDLNLTIKQRFDSAGIEFAFPTQTLYVKQDDGNGVALPQSTAGAALGYQPTLTPG
jgi:MscS family membrane protein